MATSTISTRFIIISDTHSYEFDNANEVSGAFVRPVPQADVLLHCGDLTGIGGLSELKGSLRMMKDIKAELKLVIAGNHDLSLDKKYHTSKFHEDEEESMEVYMNEHTDAMEIMTGPLARDAGVTYLEEGLHTFTLSTGAKFTIYASAYQPEFCDWAFPYYRHQDRFNPPEHVAPNVTSIVENPVPDFGGGYHDDTRPT
jgi:3',5'-cyclic AMP phosphodiesterase CpdA